MNADQYGSVLIVILILDGNSEMGAHVWSNLGYQICLRHLYTSKVTNLKLFREKKLFSLIFAQHILSNHDSYSLHLPFNVKAFHVSTYFLLGVYPLILFMCQYFLCILDYVKCENIIYRILLQFTRICTNMSIVKFK